MDRAEQGRPDERAGGHPEERQGADHPERPGPVMAAEQVGRRGRRDRDEGAAAERLDEPGGDELVEALGRPGEERPDA